MKVIVYSAKPFEKEFLIKANHKKHDITLISNALDLETIAFAAHKDAVVVFTNDDVSALVVDKLADLGVKYIATRSAGTDHIDKDAAHKRGIEIANVPVYSPQAIAEHAVAMALSLGRHLVEANEHSHHFNFKLDKLVGFNFYGKTVGLIGLGHIGQAVAPIFNGLGCRVIGYDITYPETDINVERVTLDTLLHEADIISLHLPLNPNTRYIINKHTLAKMRDGVMLINTSRGGLLDTVDVLEAIETHKLGYLGMDVYEHERGLFFEDHGPDGNQDPLLSKLLMFPNVLITPHQAFLTNEALQQIANQTIKNLDLWQQNGSS